MAVRLFYVGDKKLAKRLLHFGRGVVDSAAGFQTLSL